MRIAAWLALVALALATGCGVYGEPLRPGAATPAPASEPCAEGETCEAEESP